MNEHYHFIGIGGIGMSGLAKILLSKGKQVSGSDLVKSAIVEDLEKKGAQVFLGQKKENISRHATCVYSSDIKEDNLEFKEAKLLLCPMLHRSDLLKELIEGHEVCAVAGTHGKTTTSSLLTHLLCEAEKAPSFAVGGILPHYQTNAALNSGTHFVIEADESDGTFLKYAYTKAIITNIDTDHLAHYKSFDAIVGAFSQFIAKAEGEQSIFYCSDDPILAKIGKGVSYGFEKGADLFGSNFQQSGMSISFDVTFQGKEYTNVQVSLIGKHNALNSLAVFGFGLAMGIAERVIRKALLSFSPPKRRMEKKIDMKSLLFFDDYAHHPTEIQTTIEGIKKAFREKRLVVLFQPHRDDRIASVLDEFHGVFKKADLLIMTDMYKSSDEKVGEQLEAIIRKSHHMPIKRVSREKLLEEIFPLIQPHDVWISLGAGDISKVAEELQEKLESTPLKKLRIALLCGGMSVEHEISLLSTQAVLQHIDRDLYDIHLIYIDKDGFFHLVDENFLPLSISDKNQPITKEVLDLLYEADLVFPVLHGPHGEDGAIQGFCKTLRKPCVGCSVESSAIGMNKVATKKIVEHIGIATALFRACSESEWEEKGLRVIEGLNFPLFIKPAHLGSSVGIYKCVDEKDLVANMEKAFCYDTLLLIEEAISGREIEFALTGNENVHVARSAEIETKGQFYSYDAKYAAGGFQLTCPSDLPEEIEAKGRELAQRVYKALYCCGYARVDFFLNDEGKFYLNEVNPIPGMTQNSAFPKMYMDTLSLPELFDRMIILALERYRKEELIFHHSLKK